MDLSRRRSDRATVSSLSRPSEAEAANHTLPRVTDQVINLTTVGETDDARTINLDDGDSKDAWPGNRRPTPGTRPSRLAIVGIVAGDVLGIMAVTAVLGAWTWFSLVTALVALAVLTLTHTYRSRLTLRVVDLTPVLLAKLAVPSLFLGLTAALTTVPQSALVHAAVLPLGVLLARTFTFGIVRTLRRRGFLAESVVVLGGGAVACELIGLLRRHPEYGLVPVGYLDERPAAEAVEVPHLGSLRDLQPVLSEHMVRRVIVAFSETREHENVDLLRCAVQMGAEVHVIPRFFDIEPGDRGVFADEIRGIPIYRIRKSAMLAPAWRAKRLLDIGVTGVALLLTVPLMAVCAIAVRYTSAGPILFRQSRVGQGGRTFSMLKFRSLRTEGPETKWSLDNNLPVTPVGRMLRRSNLDELPQLWNILRGDMSLVGPRPEEPHFVKVFSDALPGYNERHRVPVGLTGLAQIHGVRGDRRLRPIAERTRFDNRYIELWSFWGDVVILLKTVVVALRRGSI